jgi:hypothetical protein
MASGKQEMNLEQEAHPLHASPVEQEEEWDQWIIILGDSEANQSREPARVADRAS